MLPKRRTRAQHVPVGNQARHSVASMGGAFGWALPHCGSMAWVGFMACEGASLRVNVPQPELWPKINSDMCR